LPFSRFFLFAFSLGVLLVAWGSLQAHLVIFKDGFTLHGRVRQETTTVFEGDVVMSMPKGFFFVDDEVRRIYFSPKQALEPDDKDPNRNADLMVLKSAFYRATNFRVPAGQYAGFTPWDEKWNRVLTIESPSRGRVKVEQHLTVLTPYFAKVDARRYNWNALYLTKELDPDAIRETLLKHPDLKLSGGSGDAAKRFRIYRFLLQAGWYDKALIELNNILKDFPDQKDKVEAARENLNKLLAMQFLDLIEQAQKCGRHQWAQASLGRFPQELADPGMMVRVRALQASYETINKNLTSARRSLDKLAAELAEGNQRSLLSEAAAVIAAELNPDTIDRLETFVGLAQQAQRDREQNRTPAYSPEQLLALAVSGWCMGNASAEPKPENAMRLWRARQIIQENQRTVDPIARQRVAASYQKNGELAYDEYARLIRLLPPPEPFEPAAQGLAPLAAILPLPEATAISALSAAQGAVPGRVYELQATLPWSSRKGPTFYLQLPPEYHPGRLYPVLFVLHDLGEKPEIMLKRWGLLAAQHGYLLVAPEWQRSTGMPYGYSSEEHRAVLDVLRDLRQRFQVDSDRVFLAGLGEGANMAYDVGLSHPDQFAGVVPMGGRPQFFASRYWPNGQYLPFYVIDGELNGGGAKDNRRQFENWISHGYPALFVQYRGRGSEWFGAELPFIFDWMNRKKRAAAFPDLGRAGGGPFGDEFQCMRPTDNRFYWLSGEGLSEKRTNDNGRNYSFKIAPATLQARISEGNQINVHANGFKTVTVWLGQGMIDFEKPVKIYINLQLSWPNRKITPNTAVLLEDLYLRGDRQRQFLAKVELSL
jgi:hypothetical protein